MRWINSCKNPACAESPLILHQGYDSLSALVGYGGQLRGNSRCEQSSDKEEYPHHENNDFSTSYHSSAFVAEDIRRICPGGPQRLKRNGEEGEEQCADGSNEERPGPEWSAINETTEPLRHREM